MTIQEKIRKKAEGFGKLAPVFLEGAKFALENQFISVEDDLPCNHEELIDGNVTHWMPIPELPKNERIEDQTMREDIRGYCNRDCIYCDNGRCDMWDDFAMPEDVTKCDNYVENF